MTPTEFGLPSSEAEGREAIVRLARLLYSRGLIAASDGNISIRLAPDQVLMTPSGQAKARMEPAELVAIDMQGAPVSAEAKQQPSTETPLHLEAYRQRPDVNAVIHAHPPYALALTVAGRNLPSNVLPEVAMTLGEVPTLPYAQPSSEQGAPAIQEAIRDHDALLLKNHGSLTVGSTLEWALVALERVEAVAQVFFLAELLGGADRLSPEQLAALRRASSAR